MPKSLKYLSPAQRIAMLYRTEQFFPWISEAKWNAVADREADGQKYPKYLGDLLVLSQEALREYALLCAEDFSFHLGRINTVLEELFSARLGSTLEAETATAFGHAREQAEIPVKPELCWEDPRDSLLKDDPDPRLFVDVREGERFEFKFSFEPGEIWIRRVWDNTRKCVCTDTAPYAVEHTLTTTLSIIADALYYQGLRLNLCVALHDPVITPANDAKRNNYMEHLHFMIGEAGYTDKHDVQDFQLGNLFNCIELVFRAVKM